MSVPADIVAKVGDPAYKAATIPANTYNKQAVAVPTVAIKNILVTHEGVPNDVVYAMTKSMYDNMDGLVAAHNAAKGIVVKDAPVGLPIPLHPGAEKYYREVGLLK